MRVALSTEDYRLMLVALEEAKHSTCTKEGRQVGSILVHYKRRELGDVQAKASNRSPLPNGGCIGKLCVKDKKDIPSGFGMEACDVLHAELMLLIKCARDGVGVYGKEIYSTCEPCLVCAMAIIASGARKLTYLQGVYSTDEGISLLKSFGIVLRPMTSVRLRDGKYVEVLCGNEDCAGSGDDGLCRPSTPPEHDAFDALICDRWVPKGVTEL